jgi:hypothetical protein
MQNTCSEMAYIELLQEMGAAARLRELAARSAASDAMLVEFSKGCLANIRGALFRRAAKAKRALPDILSVAELLQAREGAASAQAAISQWAEAEGAVPTPRSRVVPPFNAEAQRRAVLLVQCSRRGQLTRRDLMSKRAAAGKIQTSARGKLARLELDARKAPCPHLIPAGCGI